MEYKPLNKILFVDDDEDTLTIAKYALKAHPHLDIHYVTSGEAAIREAEIFKPDLILLDVMMPKMDGITTLKKLRTIDDIKDIPVAFFTAKVTRQEIASYFDLGVIDVLTKPFDPLLLSQILEQMWQTYQKKQT